MNTQHTVAVRRSCIFVRDCNRKANFFHEISIFDLFDEDRPEYRSIAIDAPADDEQVPLVDADSELCRLSAGDLDADDDRLAVVAQKQIAVRLEAAAARTPGQLDEHRVELGEKLILAHGPFLSS